MIHKTAIVSDKAQISKNVEIGAFCVVGDNVKIDEGTILKSHVVIDGNTTIGKNNIISRARQFFKSLFSSRTQIV